MINRMIERNSQVVSAVRRQSRNYGTFMLLTGVGFLIFAFLAYNEFHSRFPHSSLPCFLGVMGLLFSVLGILGLSRKSQIPKPDEPKSQA